MLTLKLTFRAILNEVTMYLASQDKSLKELLNLFLMDKPDL